MAQGKQWSAVVTEAVCSIDTPNTDSQTFCAVELEIKVLFQSPFLYFCGFLVGEGEELGGSLPHAKQIADICTYLVGNENVADYSQVCDSFYIKAGCKGRSYFQMLPSLSWKK